MFDDVPCLDRDVDMKLRQCGSGGISPLATV